LEALVIVSSFHLEDFSVLYYGTLAYGVLGLFMGMGAGIVLSLFRKAWGDATSTVYALTFALVLVPVGLVIARFRIVRDVLHERPMTLVETALLATAFLGIGAFFYVCLRALLRKESFRFLMGSTGSAGTWGLILLIGVGASSLLTAGGKDEKEPPAVPRGLEARPNIVLIVVDTLRADHLSASGYPRGRTPHIDSLASDGVLLKAYGQSSWTKPQMATILTSLYPSTHQTYLKPHVLPEEVTTLAEALKERGYHTAGIVNVAHLSPSFQFDQGYDDYVYLAPRFFFFARESSSRLCLYNVLRLLRERFLSGRKYVYHYYQDASAVNEVTIEWLKKNKNGRFFLFVHYMDPHDPYFAHPYDGTGIARVSNPNPPPEMAEKMRELYDGEIAYLDKHLGILFNFLKGEGLYDKALIVLTADHGEEFYEHGGWWHGQTLYEEQIHVPLIMKPPRESAADTGWEGPVRSLDIAPTILHYAGVKVHEAMQGRSLAENLQGVASESPIFSEEDHEHNVLQSLRVGQWKVILANEDNPRGLPSVQLFNMIEDPLEESDRAATDAAQVQQLLPQLDSIRKEAQLHSVTPQETVVDRTTQERLKALGYVE
jgi:arylsulfatase A-like enzyme